MTQVKLLSREELEGVCSRIRSMATEGGGLFVIAGNYWSGELSWARNSPTMASDRRDVQILIMRSKGVSGNAAVLTNQIDDESLNGALQLVEKQATERATKSPFDMPFELPVLNVMKSTTWKDATLERTVEESGKLVHQVTRKAREQSLLSAGYIETRGFSLASIQIDSFQRTVPSTTYYGEMTQAQCSATVRHPNGTGSGWAGVSSYDINQVDELAIAEKALDKCLRSVNAVRVEPGRYTTILEPSATSALVDALILDNHAMQRDRGEQRGGSSMWFMTDESLPRERSKLGQRIIDTRISIAHDPADPELGLIAVPGMNPITFIDKGVLTDMYYNRPYALNELNKHEPSMERMSYRMSGGSTSMDEMISTTKRGLLVTRLSPLQLVDRTSLLCTGVTRDGLWLIEDGKVTKSVRNFRFTESPLFALNNVEAMGVPERVFHPSPFAHFAIYAAQAALSQVIVPPIKVNDFSFTSTIDAI